MCAALLFTSPLGCDAGLLDRHELASGVLLHVLSFTSELRAFRGGAWGFSEGSLRSSSRGSSVKPTTRKFDWCTRSSSAVSGPTAFS